MAWVRYDDQFQGNPKVTAVIAEDPGAIALHVLANTWTNTQKRLGFIPAHQPTILLCDRELGSKWAALLVKVGLWHDDFGASCTDCVEEYADLPRDSPGYVIHNAREYRAPDRYRTTPGTSADLSAKRREAGRRGGQASAAKRAAASPANGANGQASQANNGGSAAAEAAAVAGGTAAASPGGSGKSSARRQPAETRGDTKIGGTSAQASSASKSGNLLHAGVSPEPVPEPVLASNEAREPPSAGADNPRRQPAKAAQRKATANAGDVVGAYVDAAVAAGHPRPGETLRARVGKQARTLLSVPDADFEQVLAAAREMGRRGWHDLEVQMQRLSAERNGARASPSGPYRNPEDQDDYDDWKRPPR